MIKGLVLLIWVSFIAFALQKSELETNAHTVCENYSIRRSTIKYAILLFLIPFVFAAFKITYADTESYIKTFNDISINTSLEKAISGFESNELFYAIQYLFKKYISADATSFFFVIALVQSILLIGTLRRYSENLGMSVYLFIASALYFSWMCNGIRQFLVVTILLSLTRLILKNKWYIYLPIVLFLSGFTPIYNFMGWGSPPWFLCGIHQSALIMVPIYFIVKGKALTKKVWILLIGLLLLTVFGLLNSFLETTTQNTMYAEDLTYVNNTKGANPVRFLVSLLPVLAVIIKKKEIDTDETPAIINLSINMSFVSSTLFLASVFTSGIFVGRLPIYCELYSLILIPWLINHTYEKDKRIISYFLYTLYFIYYIYQVFIAWGSLTFTVSIFGLTF